jgi:hypothetical protein
MRYLIDYKRIMSSFVRQLEYNYAVEKGYLIPADKWKTDLLCWDDAVNLYSSIKRKLRSTNTERTIISLPSRDILVRRRPALMALDVAMY